MEIEIKEAQINKRGLRVDLKKLDANMKTELYGRRTILWRLSLHFRLLIHAVDGDNK